MSKSFEFPNVGTCSKLTKIVLNDDHTIESIEVVGGCNGNLKGRRRWQSCNLPCSKGRTACFVRFGLFC